MSLEQPQQPQPQQQQEEINNMSCKKRRTASPPVEGTALPLPLAAVAMMPSIGQEHQMEVNNNTIPSFPTMEDLLGLPVDILFRQIRGGRSGGKPLMTRLEAGTFVKITLLAQELDVLIKLTENIGKQHIQYKHLCDKIIMVCKGNTNKNKVGVTVNPWLTPLIPLMYSLLHPIPSSSTDNFDHKTAAKTSTAAAAAAAAEADVKEGNDHNTDMLFPFHLQCMILTIVLHNS